MSKSRILEISAEETHPLRSLVLRHWDISTPCPFDGDADKTTHHFGCVFDNEIVSIVSFYERKNENFGDKTMVQVRGMATHPDFASKGFGSELMNFTIDFFRNRGIDLIWCNAREIAFGFYQNLSFVGIGDNFIIPEIGIHRVMYLDLN